MPDIERKGVTLSQALQEAAAIAPIDRVMLYAYELWHPTLTEPIRFVNDKEPLAATLEADAPRNASEEVEFLACPLSRQHPEESDTASSPKVTLSRPDVSALLKTALDTARGSLDSWTLIERLYASDSTSAPALLPPLQLEVSNWDLSAAAGAFDAEFDDDANEAIPRTLFSREEYPGLKR